MVDRETIKKLCVLVLLLFFIVVCIRVWSKSYLNQSSRQCPNQKETFLVSGDITTTGSGGYNMKQADGNIVCQQFGATYATDAQLTNEFNNGAQWCSYGFTSTNLTNGQYPMQNSYNDGCVGANTTGTYLNTCGPGNTSCTSATCQYHSGWCGEAMKINAWPETSANILCYGVKPPQDGVSNIKTNTSGFGGIQTTSGSLITKLLVYPWYQNVENVVTPDKPTKWSRFS